MLGEPELASDSDSDLRSELDRQLRPEIWIRTESDSGGSKIQISALSLSSRGLSLSSPLRSECGPDSVLGELRLRPEIQIRSESDSGGRRTQI